MGKHEYSGASSPPELSAAGLPIPTRWKRIISIVWVGQAISIITSGAAGYALVWFLTITTESPLILALGTAVYFLPMALLGPFAGTIVDRYSRKTVMILADLGIAYSMLLMAIIIMAGLASVPLVLFAIALRSIGTAFHQPAMLAVMPLLVPSRHLVRINTLDQGVQSVGNIIAPAIGIFFFVTIGLEAALFLDVAGAILACFTLMLVTIPAAHMKIEDRTTVKTEMLDGFHAVREVKGMTALFVMYAVGVAAFMPLASLYVLMTYSHFGGGGFEAALIEAVFGAGFLLGSIILGIWGGGSRLMRIVFASMVLQGLTFLAMGFLPHTAFMFFIILSGASAIFGAFFNGPLNAVVQRIVSPEKIGRVMGLLNTVVSLAAPIGLFIAGPIAEVIGITPWFVFGGGTLVILALLAASMPSVRTLDKRGRNQMAQAENGLRTEVADKKARE